MIFQDQVVCLNAPPRMSLDNTESPPRSFVLRVLTGDARSRDDGDGAAARETERWGLRISVIF